MKKTRLLIILFFSVLLILPLGVKAYNVQTQNSVMVPKDKTIDTNLYAAGMVISIDGTVKGDVICAGQTININGKVEGDVICAGQTININGDVSGNVRIVGNSLNINKAVGRNLMAFGATIILGSDSKIGWDALMAGAAASIQGKVGGDLHGAVGSAMIAGNVGKNVRLLLDDMQSKRSKANWQANEAIPLSIANNAVIGGDVSYTSNIDAKIESGAVIKGKVNKNVPKAVNKKGGYAAAIFMFALYLIATMVVGLVIVSLWGKQVRGVMEQMLEKVGPVIGWGAVVLFLAPILLIILMITLIGIPLALIVGALWLIALYIAKIFVGVLIGKSLLKKFWSQKSDSLILAMIIGVIIVGIVCCIPFIGWLFCLVATCWGLGGIWQYAKKIY